MQSVAQPPARLFIGEHLGLTIEAVAWDAVRADVDLSIACMFEHEMPAGAVMKGGLLDLDQTLGGMLEQLRDSGDFRAQPMETMLLERLPSGFKARSLLIIGLGDPTLIGPELLERATRVALREATRYRAKTVAFAPSLLDSGLGPDVVDLAPRAMLNGILTAFAAERRLASLGLVAHPHLSHWSFGAGLAHIKAAAAALKKAFELSSRR